MMMKSLVFAMAMALGVSATAFAANPFSDVPQGHWAYGAIAKLAAEGVVDGYPDGTFKGDKTMTRYEMAQIVAKALAKGAIGSDDKLVSEFADELDNLGVRVAKLEKNADNVKITGNVRMSYKNTTGSATDGMVTRNGKSNDNSKSALRTRLWLTGEVNDNWHYTSMLQNEQYFEGQNESGDGNTTFQRAFLDGNIGVVGLKAGRDQLFLADGNVNDNRADYVEARIPMGQAYLIGRYGKMADKDDGSVFDTNNDGSIGDKFANAVLGGDIGNLNLEATYTKVNHQNFNPSGWTTTQDGDAITNAFTDNQIWTVGAKYKMGDVTLGAMYLKGDPDGGMANNSKYDDDGYVVRLDYKGAQASKPGSWGLFAKYYDQSASTYLRHTMNGEYNLFPMEGFKGYQVGGNVTLAKNMVAEVQYYDLKGKESDNKARTLWSQLVVTF